MNYLELAFSLAGIDSAPNRTEKFFICADAYYTAALKLSDDPRILAIVDIRRAQPVPKTSSVLKVSTLLQENGIPEERIRALIALAFSP